MGLIDWLRFKLLRALIPRDGQLRLELCKALLTQKDSIFLGWDDVSLGGRELKDASITIRFVNGVEQTGRNWSLDFARLANLDVPMSRLQIVGNDVVYGSATVGTAAVGLMAAHVGRIAVAIYNDGPGTVYVGKDSAVTTGTGFPIPPACSLTLNYNGDVYVISSAADTKIRYMVLRVV